jgi:hypothetical protein
LAALLMLTAAILVSRSSDLTAQTDPAVQAAPAKAAEPVVVRVTLIEGQIAATPDPAEVAVGEAMRWTVECQKGDEILVGFEAQKGVAGPFAPVGMGAARGQYSAVGPGSIDTGIADQLPVDPMGKQAEYQEWKYSITLKSGGKTIFLDPRIRIRG